MTKKQLHSYMVILLRRLESALEYDEENLRETVKDVAEGLRIVLKS